MSNLFLILFLISFFLLCIGFISPKTSLFWYKKDRTRIKSILIYSISIILFFILFKVTVDKNELNQSMVQPNNPLNISTDSIKALIGKKVPYDKWEKWGAPKTLEGTNNRYWIAYLDSANVSFVSEKLSDKVIFADFDENSAIKYVSELKEKRKQNIQKLFSDWDGSHIKLTEKIKKSLNDPKSYEHIETSYIDRDSHIIVNTTFTAKNAFGGTLKKDVIVVSDTLGNIKEVIQWID